MSGHLLLLLPSGPPTTTVIGEQAEVNVEGQSGSVLTDTIVVGVQVSISVTTPPGSISAGAVVIGTRSNVEIRCVPGTISSHFCYEFTTLEASCIKIWTGDLLGSRWSNDDDFVGSHWYGHLEEQPQANPC